MKKFISGLILVNKSYIITKMFGNNLTCSLSEQNNYEIDQKKFERDIMNNIICFWILLFCYIYFILYEQIHLETYEIIKQLFFEPSISLDDFLSDTIIVKNIKSRSRSLSEGSQPSSDTEKFLDDIYVIDEWTSIYP